MPHQNWVKTALHISVLAALTGWGHGAGAQDSSASTKTKNADTMLDEVVVTARKITERLQDAPVSVTTMSGIVLETRGIRDLGEATKLASSVKFDSDADVRAGVSIRGVGQSSDTNAAPGVGMFVDGIYQPASAYYTIPFFDVERLEILKGPQGTLYGKNTMGGAINIISRTPTDELGGSLMLEGATGGQKISNAVINLPITGNLGNRTAFFYRSFDGFQESKTNGKNASEREDVAVRSRFVFDNDNGFISSLSLFYADLDSTPFAYSETTKGLNHPIDNVTKDTNGHVFSTYKSVNSTNSYDFGSVTLTSLTSYDRADVDTLVDGDYKRQAGLLSGGVSDRDTIAQELRLADSGADDSNLHWVLGAYYNDDDLRTTSLTQANFPPLFTPGGFLPLTTASRKETGETYAGFGQVTLTVDKFEFAAGLRYDHEERNNDTTSIDGTPGFVFVPRFRGVINYKTTQLSREVLSEEWQPKVSVSYHFTPDVMAYALASKGFRAGGFNSLTAPPEFNSYEPETTITYEGGVKSELFNRRLRLNGTVFYTNYDDILQTDITVANGAQTVISRNGGKAQGSGIEVDVAFKVSPELTLASGYTYLEIKNDEIPFGLVRKEVSGFPEHTFNFQADYLRPISNGMQFGAHLSAVYIGKTWMGTEPDKRDAHTVADASLDLTVNDITISLFGKNIFDEEYYLSYIPAGSTVGGVTALGLLNQPRQVGLRVASNF